MTKGKAATLANMLVKQLMVATWPVSVLTWHNEVSDDISDAEGIVENTRRTLARLASFEDCSCVNVLRAGSDFHANMTLSSKKAGAPTDSVNAEKMVRPRMVRNRS